MVIEANPIPDHETGVLQGLEPDAVHESILEGSDDPLERAMNRAPRLSWLDITEPSEVEFVHYRVLLLA
jgi:hypothetical protein